MGEGGHQEHPKQQTLENNNTWKVLKIKEKWSCQQNILHLKKYIPLKGVK